MHGTFSFSSATAPQVILIHSAVLIQVLEHQLDHVVSDEQVYIDKTSVHILMWLCDIGQVPFYNSSGVASNRCGDVTRNEHYVWVFRWDDGVSIRTGWFGCALGVKYTLG